MVTVLIPTFEGWKKNKSLHEKRSLLSLSSLFPLYLSLPLVSLFSLCLSLPLRVYVGRYSRIHRDDVSISTLFFRVPLDSYPFACIRDTVRLYKNTSRRSTVTLSYFVISFCLSERLRLWVCFFFFLEAWLYFYLFEVITFRLVVYLQVRSSNRRVFTNYYEYYASRVYKATNVVHIL